MRAESMRVVALFLLIVAGCGENPESSNLASATPIPKDPADQKLLEQAKKDIATHPLIDKFRLDVQIEKIENGYVELALLHNPEVLKALWHTPTNVFDAAFKDYSEQFQACRQLESAIGKNVGCKGVFWAMPSLTNEMISSPDQILKVTRRLSEMSLKKEVQAFTLIRIAALYEKNGERKTAQRILAEAVDTTRGDEDGHKSFVLSEIAAAQAVMGDFAASLDTARSITGKDDYSAACKSEVQKKIAVFQADAKKFKDAIASAQSIADEYHQSMALKDIAAAQAKSNDISAAISTARFIPRSDYKDSALVEIADTQANRRAFVAAVETANSIKSEDVKDSALFNIALAQGDLDAAQKLFEAMRDRNKASEPSSIARGQVSALSRIAKAQAKFGNREAARTTFQQALVAARSIPKAFGSYQALITIADAQLQSDDNRGAQATFQEAATAARSLGAEHFGELPLVSVSLAQAKAEDFSAAVKTALLIGFFDEGNHKKATLCRIAALQAQSGNFESAFETTRLIQHEGWQQNCLEDIGIAQAKAGRLSGAFETVGLLSESDKKAHVLRSIASDERANSDVRSHALNELLQIGNAMKDPYVRLSIFESFASAVMESQHKNAK